MNRLAYLAIAGATGALAFALPVASALAAQASGCSGEVISMDATGTEIGRATAPGDGGTQSKPLPIDMAGSVAWRGSTNSTITSGTWSVGAMGMTVLSGSFDNSDGMTSAEGVQSMSALPSQFGSLLSSSMVVPVSGSIVGDGGSCTASGYITGTTAPTSSPVFYAGAALGVVGLGLAAGVIAGTKAAAGTAAVSGGVV